MADVSVCLWVRRACAVQEIKKLLADAPGMKRKRSLSSSNSVMLEGTLPALADKFFQVCSRPVCIR